VQCAVSSVWGDTTWCGGFHISTPKVVRVAAGVCALGHMRAAAVGVSRACVCGWRARVSSRSSACRRLTRTRGDADAVDDTDAISIQGDERVDGDGDDGDDDDDCESSRIGANVEGEDVGRGA